MQRVVYTPNEESIGEAEEVAKQYGVPIIVGVSPAIEDLDFDRGQTQILMIPTEQSFSLSSTVIRMAAPVSATYIDELTSPAGVWLEVENKANKDVMVVKQHASYSTPWSAVFKFSMQTTGEFRASVKDDDGLIAYEDVSVIL